MLPFHKRSRVNSSIEIGTDELEAIELPRARPPSVRPSAMSLSPRAPMRAKFSSFSDDEMTVIRPDMRKSSAPPAPSSRRDVDYDYVPRIPSNPIPRFTAKPERVAPPRYIDDEPTMLAPSSSRPLLAMSTRQNVALDSDMPPPPPSSRAAVDPSASSSHFRASDMSMTSSVSGSTDLRRMRPNAGWAMGLVAVGIFAGLVVAFVARGEGIAAAASLVDPSHVNADVVKSVAAPQAHEQAPVVVANTQGVAVVQPASQKPAAPSCNADAVAAAVVAKFEAKPESKPEVKVEAKTIETKPVVATYTAPRQQAVYHAPPPPVAREVTPTAPAITKPIAKAVRRGGDDMESASAADALAKAQLDAALSR